MPQPEIIRTEQFTVESVTGDKYGNTMVKGTNGKSYKISEKRQQLKPIFQLGATIEVGWATYMDKEYIATAHPIDETGKAFEIVKKIQKQETQEKPQPSPGKPLVENGELVRVRSMSLAYAKDLAVAGKVSGLTIFFYASLFEHYILNGFTDHINQELKAKPEKVKQEVVDKTAVSTGAPY